MKSLGIYIHIPFCIRKCRYCDFVSYPLNTCVSRDSGILDAYFKKLEEEILSYVPANDLVDINKYYVDTIYFGGGTPTLAEPGHIGSVIQTLRSVLTVTKDCEISCEANPETLSRAKIEGLMRAGINRLSIGVQSFQDSELAAMGRVHDADKARSAIAAAESLGIDLSCDLIFGAPGQTPESFRNSMDELLSYSPQHVSFYSLQIEEGTPFYDEYRRGTLRIPPWEEDRAMYHYAADASARAGMHHYEVSNAAKPGKECRHNLKYWNMEEYLGLGTSAHSFIGSKRFANGPGILDYAATRSIEEENSGDLKGDFLFTAFRLTDGFCTDRYKEVFGSDFEEDYGHTAEELRKEGLIFLKDGRCGLTRSGLDCTNTVLEKFLNQNSREDEA